MMIMMSIRHKVSIFPAHLLKLPIGGLELLIGAGGAMAWSKLKNRKK